MYLLRCVLFSFVINCLSATAHPPSPKVVSYIINLDRSTDRLAFIAPQVQAVGYPVHRLSAVDGLTLTTEKLTDVLAPHFYHYTGHYADLGTIGCSMSHIQAWQLLVASDADYALIFEDDVAFTPGMLRRVIDELLATNKTWDLVNFQAAHRGFPLRFMTLSDGHNVVHYLTKITNAGCYLLHRSAAIKLLRYAYPLQMPVDHYFMQGWKLGITVAGVEPRLVQQTFGNSQIQVGLKRSVSYKDERPSVISIVGHESFKIRTYLRWFFYNLYCHFINNN